MTDVEQKLQEIRNGLVSLMDLVSKKSQIFTFSPDHLNFLIENNGKRLYGQGLIATPQFALQYCFAESGFIYPLHKHENSDEILTVLSGKVQLFIPHFSDSNFKIYCPVQNFVCSVSGPVHELSSGNTCKFLKNVEHAFVFLEDTYFISTTIPKSEIYPNAEFIDLKENYERKV